MAMDRIEPAIRDSFVQVDVVAPQSTVAFAGLDFPSYRNRFYDISNSYSYILLRLFGQQAEKTENKAR